MNIFDENLDLTTCKHDFLIAAARYEAIRMFTGLEGRDCDFLAVWENNRVEIRSTKENVFTERFNNAIPFVEISCTENQDESLSFVFNTNLDQLRQHFSDIPSDSKFLLARFGRIEKFVTGAGLDFSKPLEQWKLSVNYLLDPPIFVGY